MTHDDPKLSDIENDIAEERKALADSLSDLTRQLSPENLFASVSETLKEQGEDLATAVVRGARENPVALGLMGAGLAWLVLGNKVTGEKTETHTATVPMPAAPHPEPEEPGRVEQARRFIVNSAAEMRDTIHDGTSELGEMARERVIRAREKAIAAQERIEAASRRVAKRGRSFYEENPLVVAVGLAVAGAAIAAALPRTDTEDRAFGAQRDALVEEAERIWHEEVARARAMGEAALDEMKTMAEEAVDEVPSGAEAVEMAEDRLRDAGERIRSRAEEARRSV